MESKNATQSQLLFSKVLTVNEVDLQKAQSSQSINIQWSQHNEGLLSQLGKLTKPGDCHVVGKHMLKPKQRINKRARMVKREPCISVQGESYLAPHSLLWLQLLLCSDIRKLFRGESWPRGRAHRLHPSSQKPHSFPACCLGTISSCMLSRFRAVYRDVHSSVDLSAHHLRGFSKLLAIPPGPPGLLLWASVSAPVKCGK